MPRLVGSLLCMIASLLVGCSTHPCADISDYFCPGTMGKNYVQPYGGVCIPQNPIAVPLSTTLPVIGAPIAVPVVPPPAPLPGPAPAGVQLETPLPGGVPPLPPAPPKNFSN